MIGNDNYFGLKFAFARALLKRWRSSSSLIISFIQPKGEYTSQYNPLMMKRPTNNFGQNLLSPWNHGHIVTLGQYFPASKGCNHRPAQLHIQIDNIYTHLFPHCHRQRNNLTQTLSFELSIRLLIAAIGLEYIRRQRKASTV